MLQTDICNDFVNSTDILEVIRLYSILVDETLIYINTGIDVREGTSGTSADVP